MIKNLDVRITMKPDIVKRYSIHEIEGYLGLFCKCGNTLYVKKNKDNINKELKVECPCGHRIITMYTKIE